MCCRWSAAEMPKSLGSTHRSLLPMMMESSFMVPKPAATPAKPKVPVSSVTSGMVSSQRGVRAPANVFGTSRRGNGDWLWSLKFHYTSPVLRFRNARRFFLLADGVRDAKSCPSATEGTRRRSGLRGEVVRNCELVFFPKPVPPTCRGYGD